MNKNKNITKSVVVCFLIIFICEKSFAQDVGHTTQAQVNAFTGTIVNGSMAISGADITDLAPLSTLTTITGDLHILFNPLLENLDGLSGLNSIGGLFNLHNNNTLINISGLDGLTTVGGQFLIFDLEKLENINGLINLVSVGYLDIGIIPLLANIDGLKNLTTVGLDILISFNHSLKNLDGLSGLTSVGRHVNIEDNFALDNFCGLFPLFNLNGMGGIYTVNDNIINPTEADILNNCGSFSVNSKAYLEGPYNTASSNMNTTLSSIPLNSPFTEDPKSVGTIPSDVVDWVLLQLRDKLSPSTVIGNRSAFILKDGNIVDMDGTSSVLFPEIAIEYFLSVKHRNHLSVMSSIPIKTSP